MDWSSLNVLSVGLGTCVYLWSACTSQVALLGEHVLGGEQWGSQSASTCVSGRGAAWGQLRGPCPSLVAVHPPTLAAGLSEWQLGFRAAALWSGLLSGVKLNATGLLGGK